MQITFLKTVGGVILTNEALTVQYNGKQYMILIEKKIKIHSHFYVYLSLKIKMDLYI